MAAGLPVIATDTGGNAEAVSDGVTGRVVPPRDVGALASAITELAADPIQRRRMGKAGQARASAEFSIDRCVAEYESVYRSLLP